MPHTKYPRIIGFEVPRMGDPGVDTGPLVALLDVVPTDNWQQAFRVEVAALCADFGLAGASIEDNRLLIFGQSGNDRALTLAIRALVDRISRVRLDARLAASGASPIGERDWVTRENDGR